MSSEAQLNRQFHVGDTVYFTAPNKDSPDLRVQKGTVQRTHQDGELCPEPYVQTWPSLDESPTGISINYRRANDALLSAEEVLEAALSYGDQTATTADAAIRNNPQELTIIIGTTLMLRQIEAIA